MAGVKKTCPICGDVAYDGDPFDCGHDALPLFTRQEKSMSMYMIIKGTDGKFHCEGRIQDGTERWTTDSLEEAVRRMKQHAKVMNGVKIKRKDITFLEPVQVVKTEYKVIPLPKKPGKA